MTGARVAIDDDFVARAQPDVTAAILDGEAVIHHDGSLHLLDPVATLVWQCCDGEVSVATLVAELSAAFGADPRTVRHDVRLAIEGLTAGGLLTDAARGPAARALQERTTTEPPTVLVAPPSSCATCDEPTALAHGVTLHIGRSLVRVATDSPRVASALRDALRAHRHPLEDAPAYYTLTLVETVAAAGPQQLHLLARGASISARSRSARRALRALVSHLGTHGDLAAVGLAAVPGLAVGHADGVALAPPPERPVAFARGLAARGCRVADLPVALVDPGRAEVVIGAPTLTVDHGPLEALAATLPDLGPEPQPLAWGRYPLRALAVPGPATPATGLLTFGPRADEPVGADDTLDALLRILETVPVVDATAPADIAAAVGAPRRASS